MRTASSPAAALGESVLFSYYFTDSMTRQTRRKKRLERAKSLLSFYFILSQIKILSCNSQAGEANVSD